MMQMQLQLTRPNAKANQLSANESDANAVKATTVTKNGVTYAPKHYANSTVVSE